MKEYVLGVYLVLIYAALIFLFWAFIHGANGGRIPWRRFLFGWICKLRGQHVGRKPKAIVPFYNLQGLIGANASFRCICGETKHLTVDYRRGGRIPVPFAWGLRAR